jgi:hypothetical protein
VARLGIGYACHCRECQRQAASAFGLSVPVWTAELAVEGPTACWSRPTDSGAVADCHFCPACGVRLFHRSRYRPEVTTLKGGTLEGGPTLKPAAHIWARSKAEWLVLPADVPQFETQPEAFAEWRGALLPG